MKTKIKVTMTLMLSFLIIGLSACKKDKKTENPEPQPVEVKAITITDLRGLSTGATVKVPDARRTKGIIISDASAKNIDNKTIVLQEATDKPGIIITFDSAPNFAIGDEVEVNISNQTLAQVNGEIILQNIPVANAKKTGTGIIAAKQTTINDINTNKVAWNGMLVSLDATELTSADNKYKGTLTVKDASGALSSTVNPGASFEESALPLSVTKLTGIVRLNGSNVRIDIRNVNDVTSGDVTRVEELMELSKVNPNTTVTASFRSNAPALTDVNFLDPQKRCIYILVNNKLEDTRNIGNINTAAKAYDNTAKYVTVTFAGSTIKGQVVNSDFGKTSFFPEMNFPEFDPTIHDVKIAVYINVGGKRVLAESPSYKEVGKLFTLKAKLPTRDDLLAQNIPSGNVDNYLANPVIYIYNASQTRLVPSFGGTMAPVVISKVEIGY